MMAAFAVVREIVPSPLQFAPPAIRGPQWEPDAKIDWLSAQMRGIRVAHAALTCTTCRGSGLTLGYIGVRACECVLRGIFRAVLRRRLHSKTYFSYVPVCRLAAPTPGATRRSTTWGFKHEEFCGDVDTLAARTLNHRDFRIFRLRHLQGIQAGAVARIVKLKRGEVFHAIYSIESILGLKFVALRPYALYPIDEYFGTSPKRLKVRPHMIRIAA